MGNYCECAKERDPVVLNNKNTHKLKQRKIVLEQDAWKQVDSFWETHSLAFDESMPKEQAIPILEAHIKTMNNISFIDESLINSVFNSMDNDGN